MVFAFKHHVSVSAAEETEISKEYSLEIDRNNRKVFGFVGISYKNKYYYK
jgi:hypothetical protein